MKTKLYFAKYLPVGGKIEPGDWFFADPPLLEKVLYQNTSSITIPDTGIGGYTLTRAGLFLCSRSSIMPNNSYYSYKVPGFHKLDSDDLTIHSINMDGREVKVMGPISSKAKWIEERDEFDEEEVQRHHICYDTSEGCTDSYCFHCSRSNGCDSVDYDYQIKGPCGHFH